MRPFSSPHPPFFVGEAPGQPLYRHPPVSGAVVLLSSARLPQALVLLALSGAALAGCIEDGALPGDGEKDGVLGAEPVELYQTPPVPDFDFSTAIEIVHDHSNRALHENNFGVTLLGTNDLLEGQAYPWPGGYIDVDIHGDLVVVATLMGPRAFTLVDISDKAAPKVLSHFYSNEDNWDAAFSADGRYVFVACQPGGLVASAPVANCNDYDGRPTVAANSDSGFVTVDITDPANPVGVCYTPGGSFHNIETGTLDDGTIIVGNPLTELFVLGDDGCGTKVSEVPGQHDLQFQKHPITGDMLLYTGASDGTIYNVNDPKNPVEIGVFDPAGNEALTMWHEQSPAPTTIRGKHLTLGASESSQGRPGPVAIVDTTDPNTPTAIGSWILPVPPPQGRAELYQQSGYMFSEHNGEISVLGQACMGNYHAGLWIFDISTEERMREPVTLAFYQTNELVPEAMVGSSHPAGGAWLGSPYNWGCAWTADGKYVITADSNSGLYVFSADWVQPIVAT